ncbi:MAG: HD domain-containing protein [Candidatus Peribacteraceae bacterium]|nr:HD domain-containing protein [Candidatus Peribacteraceae bacterium]
MAGIDHQFRDSLLYLRVRDREEVERALARSVQLHEGQKRESGEAYVIHPITTALYLARLEAQKDMLIAALLHDTVEDGHATVEQIESEFGKTVAHLVEGVTKMSKSLYEGRLSDRQVASLRKMLLTANDDLRVILIKIADRLHNVETLSALRQQKRERIALETLDIYVPFARLVGWWEAKKQFEEICFPVAYPQESKEWHQAIERVRAEVSGERVQFIQQVNQETGAEVHAELSLMTDYEIFIKMQRVLSRLTNANAIDSGLLIVQRSSPLECYWLLGEIHEHHQARPASFRDYISTPQPNGYRALHTTVFLSQSHEFRLRIQTAVIHEYSFKRKISSWESENGGDVYHALSALHAFTLNDQQYLQNLQQTVLAERINVFTGAGEIVTLPAGATGVDFAFEIDPDNIRYLAGIRVDGGEVSEATRILNEGETVELVLLNGEKIDRRTVWVEKVKSVRARERLRQTLRHHPKAERRKDGANLLKAECAKYRLPIWWLFHFSPMQERLAQECNFSSFDLLLEEVGSGSISVGTVIENYRHLLITPPSWTIRILKWLHLLPRTRVLNKEAFLIDLEIYSRDQPGMIYSISKCFAERGINISKFLVFAFPPMDALYKIRLEVKNFQQFSDLYDAILEVPGVKRILRKR